MSKRPKDNAFQQQRLKAWQPLLTPYWVIGTFLTIGVVFCPLGAAILSASNGVFEQEIEYTNNVPPGEDPNNLCTALGSNCGDVNVTFTIRQNVKAPIYFYYKLTNFYQNHRRYVKSRSDAQLQGDLAADISSCDPLQTFNGAPLYPCGLIANSVFNDTFIATLNGAVLNWDETNIAWTSDSNKFKPVSIDNTDLVDIGPGGFPLVPNGVNDPHFMVWMRTAGLPTFKKLYAIINQDLTVGDTLQINLTNTFPVLGFSGQKFVVISTTSWLGGRNSFLGWAYIVVGIICIILGIGFALKAYFDPRELGDMKYFNWPQSHQAS
jgi:hypothetical protein